MGMRVFAVMADAKTAALTVHLRDIEHFLQDANRAELDSFVREGTDSALRRFRNRLRRLRIPSVRRRAREQAPSQTADPGEATSGPASPSVERPAATPSS